MQAMQTKVNSPGSASVVSRADLFTVQLGDLLFGELEISGAELAAATAVLFHAALRPQWRPSIAYLARVSRKSSATVKRCIRKLIDAGLLVVESGRGQAGSAYGLTMTERAVLERRYRAAGAIELTGSHLGDLSGRSEVTESYLTGEPPASALASGLTVSHLRTDGERSGLTVSHNNRREKISSSAGAPAREAAGQDNVLGLPTPAPDEPREIAELGDVAEDLVHEIATWRGAEFSLDVDDESIFHQRLAAAFTHVRGLVLTYGSLNLVQAWQVVRGQPGIERPLRYMLRVLETRLVKLGRKTMAPPVDPRLRSSTNDCAAF